MSIGLELTFCRLKQTLFLVILSRYVCTANLHLSVSLLFIRSLQFLKGGGVITSSSFRALQG